MQLNKNVWMQTMKVFHPEEEHSKLDQLFAVRQTEVDEKLRKKPDALRQRRARAKGDNAEQVRWEVGFDIERLNKCLISVHEIAPFVDCETVVEDLHTRRMFAYAFRCQDIDCPDIRPTESINEFCKRVTVLWYDRPLIGEKQPISRFVRLDTSEFDNDLGFLGGPYDGDWFVRPSSEVTLTAEQIAALPMVGKPVPPWKKEGFASYKDWWDHEEEEKRKQKGREELNKYLNQNAQDAVKKEETKTPQLLYQGIITEH